MSIFEHQRELRQWQVTDGIVEGDYKAAKMTVGRWSEASHLMRSREKGSVCINMYTLLTLRRL